VNTNSCILFKTLSKAHERAVLPTGEGRRLLSSGSLGDAWSASVPGAWCRGGGAQHGSRVGRRGRAAQRMFARRRSAGCPCKSSCVRPAVVRRNAFAPEGDGPSPGQRRRARPARPAILPCRHVRLTGCAPACLSLYQVCIFIALSSVSSHLSVDVGVAF
jgi:hypothetical protein